MADKPTVGARARRPALPRRQPCPPRRGRGDKPCGGAVAIARRPDPLSPCLGWRGDRGHSQRPTKGLKIYGETCPQYLFLTADDLAKPGIEGAKFCCSPPPRDRAAQQAVWTGLRNGTFQVFSSDHAPYRFDSSGKLPKGDK